MQRSDDGAVGERELPFTVSLHRHIVAQDGAQTIEVAGFMRRGNPLPVAISVRNLGNVVGGSFPVCVPWRRSHNGNKSGYCCKGNKKKREAFHDDPLPGYSGKLKIGSVTILKPRNGLGTFREEWRLA